MGSAFNGIINKFRVFSGRSFFAAQLRLFSVRDMKLATNLAARASSVAG